MTWDRTLPDGDISIAQGDDDIRENNTSLETALSVEHNFTSGASSVQTGVHTFREGDSLAALNSLSPVALGNSIAFRTDVKSDGSALYYLDPTGWLPVECDAAGVARRDEDNTFEKFQLATWTQVFPTGQQIQVDFLNGPIAIKVTLVADATVQNPSNLPATNDLFTSINLMVIGDGSSALNWQNEYVTAYGLAPPFDGGLGIINMYNLTRIPYPPSSDRFLVTAFPAIGAFV